MQYICSVRVRIYVGAMLFFSVAVSPLLFSVSITIEMAEKFEMFTICINIFILKDEIMGIIKNAKMWAWGVMGEIESTLD